jgi:hypothetical protein
MCGSNNRYGLFVLFEGDVIEVGVQEGHSIRHGRILGRYHNNGNAQRHGGQYFRTSARETTAYESPTIKV